jgi:hypothetical protein
MVPASTQICPECEHIFVVEQRRPFQPFAEVELTQVLEVQKPASQYVKKREIDSAETLGDLYRLAKRWGYRPGWAWHIWQDRQRKSKSSVLELLRMPEKQQEDVSSLRSRVSKAMAIKSIATSLSQLQEVAELMEYDPEWPYREAQRLGIPVYGQ